jgi:single-strand DNA-binding protein
MKGFSKAILAGNLTRDPETRTTPNGASVTGFTLAVNRSYKDANGQNKEQTSFIDCTAWGKPGEIIAQYTKKGSALLVSGRLDQRSWEDKDTKQKRSKVEVTVEDFTFLSGGGDRGGDSGGTYGGGANNAPTQDVVPEDVGDEPIDLSEIPF